jgi:hypothetical protein
MTVKLASNEDARRIRDTIRDNDFLDFVTQGILDDGAQVGKLSCFSLANLLLILSLLKFWTFLRNTHKLLAVEFFELTDGVFVDGIDKEENLEPLLLEHFDEGLVSGSSKRFAGKVIDRLLVFRHMCNIVYNGNKQFSFFKEGN